MAKPRLKKKYYVDKTKSKVKYVKECKLMQNHGLRSKKELGRVYYEIARARKALFQYGEQNPCVKRMIDKMIRLGVLSTNQSIFTLHPQRFLNRRLQSILVERKLCKTLRQARQKIVHGKVKILGKIKRFPGYLIRKQNQVHIVVN